MIAAAFADTYRMLERRIGTFVNVASAPLDSPNLKKQLEEIGETENAVRPLAATVSRRGQ